MVGKRLQTAVSLMETGLIVAGAKSKRTIKKRPMWMCPKCGHKFVTRNMWHSCRRYPLSYFFRDKDPVVRQLFDQLLALVSEFGPVIMSPVKTGIALQVWVRFAGHPAQALIANGLEAAL